MESQINELQEKYWAGETSLEEEKILKAYFENQNNNGLESEYFAFLKKKKNLKTQLKFEYPQKKILFSKWWMAAAITVGILFGAYLLQISENQNEFIVSDPQKAYEITREALFTISKNMNKGTAYAGNLEKFVEAQEIISK